MNNWFWNFHFSVTKVILCSGKHYYALDKHRQKNNIKSAALIRLEVRAYII